MPRYALKIEYDGGPFSGWQAQADRPSVQEAVENALARIDQGYADGARIAAAGRTDAGVHATGQVAHADLGREWDSFRMSEALNFHLKPAPIAILAAVRVDDNFHARFSALERRYCFRLISRRAPLTHQKGRAWQVTHHLDLEAMREGAAFLIGMHDFTTFRSSICQAKSPVKTMDRIEIDSCEIPGGYEYQFRLQARSFLHNQVRSIVGSLERVGAGSWAPSRIGEALAARDRASCGPVCPPHGLYLTDVRYPDAIFGDCQA